MKTSSTCVFLLGLLLTGGCDGDADVDDTTTEGTSTGAATAESTSTGATSTGATTTEATSTGATSDAGTSTGAADDETSAGTTTGGEAFAHCEPEPEDPLSDTVMGMFGQANEDMETHTMSLSTPAGGYVTASFTPGLARGGVFAYGGGDIDVFNTVEQGYEEPVDIAFLAAPGISYRLEGRQQANANPDEYPFGWSMSWTATPIPDCWEPNDSVDDASDIAVGHSISGYINAGQVDGEQVPAEGWLDFYRVEVEEAGVLTVDMKQVPGDGLVRVRVLDDAGEQVGSIAHPSEEFEPFSGMVDVEPGIYFIRVNPFLRPTLWVADDSDVGIPSSWTTPYIFELTLDPS